MYEQSSWGAGCVSRPHHRAAMSCCPHGVVSEKLRSPASVSEMRRLFVGEALWSFPCSRKDRSTCLRRVLISIGFLRYMKRVLRALEGGGVCKERGVCCWLFAAQNCQRDGRYREALPWSAWYTLRVPVITRGCRSFHSLYPRLDSHRPYGALEHSGAGRLPNNGDAALPAPLAVHKVVLRRRRPWKWHRHRGVQGRREPLRMRRPFLCIASRSAPMPLALPDGP